MQFNYERENSEELDIIINLITNLRGCTPYKTFHETRLGRCSVAVVLRFDFGLNPPKRDLGSHVEIPNPNHLPSLMPLISRLGYGQTRSMRKKDWRLVNLLDDVRKYQPKLQVLIMRRASRKGDRWSGHACFPGGKRDHTDISDYDTAIREFNEEIGINLKSSKHFIHLGELDDRYIKSALGLKNIMILSPQVFLQVSRKTPVSNLSLSEVESVGWINLDYFTSYLVYPTTKSFPTTLPSKTQIKVPMGKALFPSRNKPGLFQWMLQNIATFLFGQMHFTAIQLPDPLQPTKLWGLSLSVLSDLLDMAHNPKLVAHLEPLDHPFPKLDWKEINYVINLLCPVDGLRKPVTSRVAFGWDHYFSTLLMVMGIALVSRVTLLIALFKYLLPFVKKLKLRILKRT